MDIGAFPARGLLHFAEAKQKESIELEVNTSLVDLYDVMDEVYDSVRSLEQSLSTVLYGQGTEFFPLRTLGMKRR